MASSLGYNNDTILHRYIVGASAAITAETVTYPLDITKTRLQIQGETNVSGSAQPAAQSKRGMLRMAFGIATEEGILKLWQGLSPAIYRQAVYSGIRMPLYEWMKTDVFSRSPDGSLSLWKLAVCSGLAGSIGQFCANPTDLIKVRMQMEGRRLLEGKPQILLEWFSRGQIRTFAISFGPYERVKNFSQAFRAILAEEGIRGLWRGWVLNVQRAALINIGEIVTYDFVKRQILKRTSLKDNYIVHISSSAFAGFMASVLCTPADVLKSRVMNQPVENGRGVFYRGTADCFSKTIRNEGPLALYKGFLPGYCRMQILLEWFSRGQIRTFAISFGPYERVKNFSQAFRAILAEEGIRGLWRGWVLNVQRAALINIGEIVTYDFVKRQILKRTSLKDNYIVHISSSAFAGFMASVLCTPADVLKSRVMNQPVENGRGVFYRGTADCFSKTIRNEGPLALYKGFLPGYCRMGPWSLTFWVTYEKLRVLFGHAPF